MQVHFSGTPLLVLDAAGDPIHPDLMAQKTEKSPTLWQSLLGMLTCSQKDVIDSQETEQETACPANPVNDSFPLKFGHRLPKRAYNADFAIDEEVPGSILECRRNWESMFALSAYL